MIRSLGIALAITAALIEPATADEYYAVTPSGNPEAYFGTSVVQTSDLFANKCIDMGWRVISSTDTVIICQAPMNFGQSLLSAMLIGNQYSTPPQLYYRFNLAGVRVGTRAQVTSWIETQMAFGQIRKQDFAGPPFHNSAMDFFAFAGGLWPEGTSFPNHAYLGIAKYEAVSKPEQGLRIFELEPAAPAAAAGLKEGDVLVRIARERVKDQSDIMDALAKGAKAPTFEVEFYRDGKKQKVMVDRGLRSPVGAPEFAEIQTAEAAPTNIVAQPISLADELAKLAKLRDDGILTAEEFDRQKAKLLAD